MAPSVRVRRKTYSNIDDTFSPDSTLRRSVPPAASSRSPERYVSTASPTSTNGPSQDRAPNRRRLPQPQSWSRVQHHISSRASQPLLSDAGATGSGGARTSYSESRRSRAGSPMRYSVQDGMATIEGSQADIRVRSDDGEPGRVGSALSLPHSPTAMSIQSSIDEEDSDMESVHEDDIVEHLDVIDPQVATVSNLTNAANAILIPPFAFYTRKPVVVLSPAPTVIGDQDEGDHHTDSLDRHVNDVLKRPSKFRRTMKGVWSFLKTPLGIIAAIYGFAVVFWGAAIVFFLAKFINFHNANTQGFWVEVSSQVVNGLFTVTGVGLIPSRVLDTYRIIKIWRYKRRTARLRKKAGLPELYDVDDLPDPAYDPNYVHVLTDAEQKDLHREQVKFQRHQTWYRAHGSETHRAFPINTALLICLFNDGNSIFQVILCGCMWGLNRFERPAWTTGILIPASFLCGIASGVFIWRGGQRTKRREKVEAKLRAALAMEHPYRVEGLDAEDAPHSATSGQETQTSAVEDKKPNGNDPAVDEHMLVPKTEK